MCKDLSRSDGQQRNASKVKFPSNLNCGQKIVSETGPRTGKSGQSREITTGRLGLIQSHGANSVLDPRNALKPHPGKCINACLYRFTWYCNRNWYFICNVNQSSSNHPYHLYTMNWFPWYLNYWVMRFTLLPIILTIVLDKFMENNKILSETFVIYSPCLQSCQFTA